MTRKLTPEEKVWNRLDREMRERTDVCPDCGGVGEVLGWNSKIDDSDLLECGKCDGYGRLRPVKKGALRVNE